MIKSVGLMLSAIVALQGCSSASTKQNGPANVTSSPSAAAVYANGLKIGDTPLHADLYKAFPASWIDWVYQATGVLMVKKPGCKDYVLKVNDFVLSQPIHAKLECDPALLEQKEAPVPSSKVKPAEEKKAVIKADDGIEGRLRQLDALYKQGLISKDEYQATRKRILSEI